MIEFVIFITAFSIGFLVGKTIGEKSMITKVYKGSYMDEL